MRLTEQREIIKATTLDGKEIKVKYIHIEDKTLAEKKLFEFENIENELGVDLAKLLSARKVYYMGWNRNCDTLEIKETYKLFVNLTDRTIEYYENEYSEFTFDLELKNYGKNNIYGGWALTREELEKWLVYNLS